LDPYQTSRIRKYHIKSIQTRCGGGSKTEVKQAPQTALGQELLDLDKAHQQGAISIEAFIKEA
jgi:hypothetical protein